MRFKYIFKNTHTHTRTQIHTGTHKIKDLKKYSMTGWSFQSYKYIYIYIHKSIPFYIKSVSIILIIMKQIKEML